MTSAGGPVPRFVSAVPALSVSDEARAVAFFVDVLGFESRSADDGSLLGIVRRDAVEVHVWVADGSAKGAERHLAAAVDAVGDQGAQDARPRRQPRDAVRAGAAGRGCRPMTSPVSAGLCCNGSPAATRSTP